MKNLINKILLILQNNKIATSFGLGALYVLAFAPFYWFVLGFACMFGLIVLVKNANSVKQAIIILFAFNLAVGLFNFYWIFFSVNHIMQNAVLSLLLWLGFILLYFVFFVPLLLVKTNKPYNLLFVLKVFVALLIIEYLKLHWMNGFAWLIMPAMYNNLLISQLNYMFGVFGFTVLNIAILSALFVFKIKNMQIFNKILLFSPPVLMLLILLLFSVLRFNNIGFVTTKNQQHNIRIVNTNIPQQQKFSASLIEQQFYSITNKAFSNINVNNLPEYIVFPEVVFGFMLEDNPSLFNYFLQKIPQQSTVILGVLRKQNQQYYNSIYIINGKTKKIDYIYDKQNLVPFGEYIPFNQYLPFLNNLGFASLSKGNFSNITTVNKVKLGLSICFEAIFSNKNFTTKNIDMLINISNEAWFNFSKELPQYNKLLQMRAIEGNIPVIKATNLGEFVVFNANGKPIIIKKIDKLDYHDFTIKY